MALALSGARVAVRPASRPAARCLAVPRPAPRNAPRHVVRASSGSDFDFDAVLNGLAEKFEKSQNKPAIIGYSAAAVFVFFTAEWLIHLPALDVLLGFPVQLLGLLMLPYLGLRYLVDGGDVSKDVEAYTAAIVKKLPGLDK